MNSQNTTKFNLFLEFLAELFKVDLNGYKSGTVKLLSLDLQELAKELKRSWNYLYDNCLHFPSLQEEYLEKFHPWKEKYDSFVAAKDDNSALLTFLENYFSKWMKLTFKSKDITREEIAEILKHEKPSFLHSQSVEMGSYKNLLIFEDDSFRLTAHLKLKEYKTNTFSLVIIYSFWFNNIFEPWEANLEVINDNYRNVMIAYNVSKKLKSLGYEESPLIVEEPKSGNKFVNPFTFSENLLHPSNNLVLEILSNNPIRLFKELITHMSIITDVIESYESQNDLSPYTYFENLTFELKQFLLKGKELFLKAEDFVQKSTAGKETKKAAVEKSKIESKISFEEIIGFFKDAIEKDRSNDTILPENKGFRTQNQIYDEYGVNIEGSKPTFYNYFDSLKLDSFLEVRSKSGRGGGKEYRYKELTLDSDIVSYESSADEKPRELEDLSTERIEIQEALSCYNTHDFEGSIHLFTHGLQSKKLGSNHKLFTSCLYYLGRSYFKAGDYTRAMESLNKAYMNNPRLINVKHALAESHLHLQQNESALKLVNEVISEFRNIITSNGINLNLDYIFIRPVDIDSLDIIHPEITEKDMLSNLLILLNKPTIAVQFFQAPSDKIRNEIFWIVNNNITSLQILFKKYLNSLYMKFELLRRMFFKYALEQDEEHLFEILNEFLNFFRVLRNDIIITNSVSLENFSGYILYFKGILKIFNFPALEQQISKDFPDLKYQTAVPSYYYYVQKFTQFYNFLSYANELLYKDFERDDRILHLMELNRFNFPHERFSNLDLKAEYYFLEAYLNLHYLVDNRIKSEEKLNNTFEPTEINTHEDVFRVRDEFHSRWFGSRHPKDYLDMAEKAHKYAQEHNFNYLTKHTRLILEETKEKYAIIEEFRLERRKKVINKKLEILSKSYEDLSQEITLDFQKKPKEGFNYFVRIKIRREIEKILKEKKGNISFNLHLFNPELNKDVITALSNEKLYRESVEGRTRSYFLAKMNIEESKTDNTINVNPITMRDLRFEGGIFEENLDKITWLIYNAININLNSLTLILDPKDREKYQMYFDKDFKNEYENDYFKFNLLQNWVNDEITIQINKI